VVKKAVKSTLLTGLSHTNKEPLAALSVVA